MRITCPGCGAAYEVPDRAVPDPGRDVQCAACGASWFLLKGGTVPTGVHAAGHPTGDRPTVATRGQSAGKTDPPGSEAGASIGGPDRGKSDAGQDDGPDAGPSAGPDVGPDVAKPTSPQVDDLPPRRRVDPAVLAILREEAETERRARAAASATRRDTAGVARSDGEDATAAEIRAAGDPPASPRTGARDPHGSPGSAAFGSIPARGGAGLSDAHGRIARLTAAERHAAAAGSGPAAGTWDNAGHAPDDGLVEVPHTADRGPRPPFVGALPTKPPLPAGGGRDGAGLPVAVAATDHRALVRLTRRRRGFRLGFAASAGLCCAALAAYLVALRAGGGLDGPVAEAIVHHGGQVQSALVDWLRRVVVPALS